MPEFMSEQERFSAGKLLHDMGHLAVCGVQLTQMWVQEVKEDLKGIFDLDEATDVFPED